MKNTYLLGIDIGTSGVKAAVFSPEGSIAAEHTENYNVYYPAEGYAEQDADEWYIAAAKAVRALFSDHGISPADIACIGIDGQGWSAIPIDREGRVLARTPIWFDTRAADICAEFDEKIGADAIFSVAGNPLQPSYTTPKIIWYERNMPEIYSRIYKILQSNSFIAYRLTGELSQDICQSYGLHFFNMRTGCYDEEMAKEFGIPLSFFPDISACHDIIGRVTAKASAETGLLEGTPVVAGGLDAACGTLGAGVMDDGETQEQGGQAGGMSIATRKYVADKRLILSFHVVPGIYLFQGGTVGGGGVMNWLDREFCGGAHRFSELTELAESVPPGCDGMTFLPYMAGERSPIWNPKAKGVFYGVDYRKTKAHFIRAALEGTVFALEHNMRVAKEAGADALRFHSMGGAANSPFWTQMKADVTGKSIVVPYSDQATTLGAAILAGVGCGVYSGFDEARKKTLRIVRRHEPDPAKKEIYDKVFDRYIELYENLKYMMR